MPKSAKKVRKDSDRFVFKEYTFTYIPNQVNTYSISLKEKCFDVDFIRITLIFPENTVLPIPLLPQNLQIIFCDVPCNGHQFCMNIGARIEGQSTVATFEHSTDSNIYGYSILTSDEGVVSTNIIVFSYLPAIVNTTPTINQAGSCWTFVNGVFYLESTGELNTSAEVA